MEARTFETGGECPQATAMHRLALATAGVLRPAQSPVSVGSNTDALVGWLWVCGFVGCLVAEWTCGPQPGFWLRVVRGDFGGGSPGGCWRACSRRGGTRPSASVHVQPTQESDRTTCMPRAGGTEAGYGACLRVDRKM